MDYDEMLAEIKRMDNEFDSLYQCYLDDEHSDLALEQCCDAVQQAFGRLLEAVWARDTL